ncbi:FAD-dependent thymidylate synthase [compost metagenome]
MIELHKSGLTRMIKATIVAHSKSSVTGKEIITWELEYPRFIHSELMTHRLFSRNAASSRAIPVAKIIEQVRTNPAMPVHWGINQPGMQASSALSGAMEVSAKYLWRKAADGAAWIAEQMVKLNLHKQVVNRLLEPFQMMKTVVTATEFDNWYWLRNHPDAQPEIRVLAALMLAAYKASEAIELRPGDWHTPYYGHGYWKDDSHSEKYAVATKYVFPEDREDFYGVTLKDALAISSSCCAQVSYRVLDDSVEKARDIYKRLVESKPVHASPFEHQATPMKPFTGWDKPRKGDTAVNQTDVPYTWELGITHVDRQDNLWSGNFKDFIQHRQLIPANVCWDYEENV